MLVIAVYTYISSFQRQTHLKAWGGNDFSFFCLLIYNVLGLYSTARNPNEFMHFTMRDFFFFLVWDGLKHRFREATLFVLTQRRG